MTTTTLLHQLEQYSEQLINLVTFNQLSSAKQIYLHWLSTASVSNPDILSILLAGLFVVLKFCLPLTFVGVVLSKLTKNLYILFGSTGVVAVLYSYLFFDPYSTFKKLAFHIQAFREFLVAALHSSTQPFLFTFLTNMAVVFGLKLLFSGLALWVFFAIILGLVTLIIWILTGGKNPWNYTEKQFKPLITQVTLAFLIFYAVFGAFKAFLMTIFLLLGSISIVSGLRSMMGYQKHCYVDSGRGEIVCRWVKK